MQIPLLSRRALPLCAALLTGVVWHGVPRDAEAKPATAAKIPIAVGSFAGPQQTKVRAKVMDVLRKSGSYEVTDAEDIKPGAKKAAYASMAQAMGVNAIVVGVISKRHNLTVTVYDANGARVDAIEIKGGGGSFGLQKAIDNELEISIADPIARAKPGSSSGKPASGGGKKAAGAAAVAPKGGATPPATKAGAGEEEEPELTEDGEIEEPVEGEGEGEGEGDASGEASESEGEDVDAPSAPSEPGLRPVEVMVGLRGYSRAFEYTDPQSNKDYLNTQLNTYELPLAPAIILSGRFYPAALFSNGWLSHVGLTGRYELTVATGTTYSEKTDTGQTVTTALDTSAAAWHLGLRGRLTLGPHELGMFAEYGTQSFILKGDEEPVPLKPYALVPDVTYTFIRTGIDLRLYFGKVLLGGHVAPRFLTSLHEIDLAGIWFPGATGSGLDFGVMGGYRLLPFLSVVGGVDVLRYGFDFNGIPDCPSMPWAQRCPVAGGATDTYLSGYIAAMFHLDGSAAAKP